MATQYPEHAKLRAVMEAAQTIGEFIEWLGPHGYHICEERKSNDSSRLDLNVPPPDSKKSYRMGDAFIKLIQCIEDSACVYWPTFKRPMPEVLLAEYFGIDRDKLEAEKLAMLEVLRAPRKDENGNEQ